MMPTVVATAMVVMVVADNDDGGDGYASNSCVCGWHWPPAPAPQRPTASRHLGRAQLLREVQVLHLQLSAAVAHGCVGCERGNARHLPHVLYIIDAHHSLQVLHQAL